MNRRMIAVLALLISASCSLPLRLGGSAKSYYLLMEENEDYKQYPRREKQILVREMLASGFIESQRIVFSRDDIERGFYQFANWTEFPSKRLADLLLNRIRGSGMFASASRALSGAVADYQLNTELNEFVHSLAGNGEVRVVVSAEVIDLRNRRVIGSRRFSSWVKVTANDAQSAVRGFGKAVSDVNTQIVEWLDRTLPRDETTVFGEQESEL